MNKVMLIGNVGVDLVELLNNLRYLLRSISQFVKMPYRSSARYIEGKIHTRSYEDNQGRTRYVTEIWADAMEMLTPKPQSQSPEPAAT